MAVDLSFFRSETSQRLRAEDILLLLEERGIAVPDEARARIAECHDPDVLKGWFRRAITAASIAEVFAED